MTAVFFRVRPEQEEGNRIYKECYTQCNCFRCSFLDRLVGFLGELQLEHERWVYSIPVEEESLPRLRVIVDRNNG